MPRPDFSDKASESLHHRRGSPPTAKPPGLRHHSKTRVVPDPHNKHRCSHLQKPTRRLKSPTAPHDSGARMAGVIRKAECLSSFGLSNPGGLGLLKLLSPLSLVTLWCRALPPSASLLRLNWFNAELSPKRYRLGTAIPEGAGRGRLYLWLHCHHQNDSCINQSHFNVLSASSTRVGSS